MLERYIALLRELEKVQEKEEELLNEMDTIWDELTPEEQELAEKAEDGVWD